MPRNTCIPCHRRHAISVAANGSARKQRQPATSHRRQPTSSKVYNTNVHVAVTTQEVSVRRLTLPLRTPPASAAALVPIPRLSRAHCSPLLLLPSTLLPAPPPPPPLLSPPSHPPHCCVNGVLEMPEDWCLSPLWLNKSLHQPIPLGLQWREKRRSP